MRAKEDKVCSELRIMGCASMKTARLSEECLVVANSVAHLKHEISGPSGLSGLSLRGPGSQPCQEPSIPETTPPSLLQAAWV